MAVSAMNESTDCFFVATYDKEMDKNIRFEDFASC